jgi:hypothetical protein
MDWPTPAAYNIARGVEIAGRRRLSCRWNLYVGYRTDTLVGKRLGSAIFNTTQFC